jgi:hypothetical protein
MDRLKINQVPARWLLNMKPPSVVLDNGSAEVQFDGVSLWRIDFSQVREIAIEVLVYSDLGHSEAFWKLTGSGVEFFAPVELIAGAEEFRARLFAFPGFDHLAYQHAIDAEAKAEAGLFVCWRD